MTGKPTYQELEARIIELERVDRQRRRTEKELQDLYETMDLAQKMAGIGYWSFNKKNGTRFWSKYMYVIFGRRRELGPPQQQDLKKIFHPQDWDTFDKAFEGVQKGIPYDQVARILFPDGSVHYLHTQGFPKIDENGEVIGSFGISQNITERILAQKAVRESEARFRRIFENSVVGFFQSTPSGRFIAVNQAFAEMLHYESPEELIATISDITTQYYVNPGDRQHYQQILRDHGQVDGFEFKARCKDGSEIWVSNSTRAYVDEKGAVMRYEGVVSNITTRKQSEEALIRSERKWRNILVNTPQVGVSLDPLGRIVFANTHFLLLTGWKERQVIGKDWFDMFIPESIREEVRGVFRSVMTQKDTSHFSTYENEILTKTGDLRNVAWSNVLTKDSQGNIVDVTCLGIDLTERRRAEMVLRESEEKFRGFSEQSFVGFYIIQDGVFKYVNPKFAEIFGYTVDECMDNMHFHRLVHPEDLARVHEQVRRRIDGEVEVVQHSFRGIKKTGETIHVQIYGSSLPYDGRPAAIGTMLDITKDLELEKQIAQAQRIEALGALAGGIAHDFNNLLFPIVGLSEMLLEDLPPGSPEHESTQEIYNAASRGRDLVKQIVSFSRQTEHEQIPTRLQQIITEVVKLARSTIPTDIQITTSIQKDCGLAHADPTQVHQIAMNLITNAFHAVETTGGSIDVQFEEIRLPEKKAAEMNLAPGRYGVLAVSDTGYGIEPDVMDKIFEPYFTTKGTGKGTGLGLAVVHGIVRNHGGCIRVQSNPGQGTDVTVYLPLIAKAPMIKVDSRETQPNYTGTEHILVVDDEEPIVRLERQMLERLGYRTTSRVSAVDALEAFKSNPDAYDMVITDMTMPNMTGDRLAKELMKIRPNIPVIICTGFSERINQEKAAQLGIKGFLMKPVVRSDLAGMIREVLDTATDADQG